MRVRTDMLEPSRWIRRPVAARKFLGRELSIAFSGKQYALGVAGISRRPSGKSLSRLDGIAEWLTMHDEW
jgi:hypothetical protein